MTRAPLTPEQELRRLRWRCRRGMRELDTLLMAFMDQRYRHAPEGEQEAFRLLLSMPDPEIVALLNAGGSAEDGTLGRVVEQLLEQRLPAGG